MIPCTRHPSRCYTHEAAWQRRQIFRTVLQLASLCTHGITCHARNSDSEFEWPQPATSISHASHTITVKERHRRDTCRLPPHTNFVSCPCFRRKYFSSGWIFFSFPALVNVLDTCLCSPAASSNRIVPKQIHPRFSRDCPSQRCNTEVIVDDAPVMMMQQLHVKNKRSMPQADRPFRQSTAFCTWLEGPLS